MLDLIDAAFESLFFGSGMILGLLLIIILILSIASKWKWGNIFVLPITILMAMEYISRLNQTGDYKHFWGAIICFLLSVFIVTYTVYSSAKG